MNYEAQGKLACAPTPEEPMSVSERSMATYKALLETNDILDSIASLMSGNCNCESIGGMPDCLDGNIDANMYWANTVRDRVKSLAMVLGVKDF